MLLPTPVLKKILTTAGYLTDTQFDAIDKSASDLGKSIGDILVFRGIITEEVLGKLVSSYYQVPYASLKNTVIPQVVLSTIPEQAAASFHMIPFAIKDGQLYLALENPQDIEAIEFAKRSSGIGVIPHYITPSKLEKALGQYKKNIREEFKKIIEENIQATQKPGATPDKNTIDLPVTKILDTLLEYSVAEGASDVHIEALENEVIIRFRVDGILRDVLNLPKQLHLPIVARIKILSQLKIDEHRVPQDGRFKFKVRDNFVALRVSILPSFYGENVVMRLLPESARPLSLEELGFAGDYLEKVKQNIKKPHGMVLVTGPTGSGKTTTLYSLLNILNTPEVNICTIEDPVEYGIRRVNQVQVNTVTGLTFAAGLRALLRHDPNIIMIGEIRDSETAEIAIPSALTGHLVLSTLHTNNAAGALPRLLDMGTQNFLVASTVNLIIAQRLVRRICNSCITKYTPNPEIIEYLKKELGSDFSGAEYYKGTGCAECGMSGYKGRLGIYEVLEVSEGIRNLIANGATSQEVEVEAFKQGMVKLFVDGVSKANAGITTIEEVLRVMRE